MGTFVVWRTRCSLLCSRHAKVRTSSDRLVGGPCGSVPVAEDEEVTELCFLVGPSVATADTTEGNGDPEFLTELGPPAEVVVVGTVGSSCGGLGGGSERSAETIFE